MHDQITLNQIHTFDKYQLVLVGALVKLEVSAYLLPLCLQVGLANSH